ncbi:MAG: EAL domain-containing protein [Terracidiphilus sp.]|nr:EAL domain-containing protein [Terracidiphilus sp.]
MRISTKSLLLLLVSALALSGLFLIGEWGDRHSISPIATLCTIMVTYAVSGVALFRWWRIAGLVSGSKSAELAMERRIEERTRALRQEIEERKRAEHLNRGQKHVLEMLADPRDLTTEEVLQALADVVASRDQGWECSVYLVERRGRLMTLAASSGVHERMVDYFKSVGKDYPDVPECQAAFSGEMHIVEHLAKFDVPWSQALVSSGIFSVCSLPFCSSTSGRLTGVLTIYSRSRSCPTGAEVELMESAARLAALVVEHRSIRNQLVRAAYQDNVTELPNRRAGEQALEDALTAAKTNGQELAVVWVDINRFKHLNDHFGPAAGDHVLRTVGDRLKHHPLVTGAVARMGEDEFLVLIPGAPDSIDAIEIARRLNAAVSKPVFLDSARIDVSAGVGAAVYPQDGTTAKLLSRNADRAMTFAKASGEGYCVYTAAMSEEANETLKIEEGLSAALENNYLRLVYQPIFAADGRLINFEALLRFQHPELGNIPPSRFIPVAEETRLIVPIGNWVLREACRQLREWREAGLPSVGLSVNICALQFARDDFSDTVASVIEEYGIDPELITIELTESVLMGDYPSVVRQMKMLRQCGVHIAMDDFGTAYSSLSYLHLLPVDVLKIDRTFIEKLTEPEGTRPIVEAVISMAQKLGLTAVAEGVETEEQHAILEAAGCHQYQGFLFARPLERVDTDRCLRASRIHRFANPALDIDEEEAIA